MDMNNNVRFDDTKYKSGQFDRITSAPPYNAGTVIKYIAPRVISTNIASSIQGPYRGVGWSNVYSTFPTATTPTASLGLAALVQNSMFTTIPLIHSIDGERIIDEHRELSRLTETLGNSILQCCNLEAHNHALESQIEWLENHRHENGVMILKMFRSEIDSAKKLIHDNLQHKPPLESKVNEAQKTTFACDEQYQQLLSKRNAFSKELFEMERQIAQNNAESKFLQRRIHHLDDESKFYLLKNHALHDRKVRLRHDLDEDIFSQQALKAEIEILDGEKITNEDVNLSSYDDTRNSIDITQVAGMQSSKYYSEQLNNEVQRIRNEYENKVEVYRDELHRKFELELHRYQIQKSRPSPMITKDQQLKSEQYSQERKEIIRQIAATRGRINEIIIQIETLEKQIITERTDPQSSYNTKRHLSMLNQLIQDREQQLNEAFRIRNALKHQIENYRERHNRYSRDKTQNYFNKRASMQELPQTSISTSLSIDKSTYRLSLQDLSYEYHNEQQRASILRFPPSIIQSTAPPQRSSRIHNEDLWEEGTLTKFNYFDIDKDCNELHRLLNDSNQDELAIIKILCNRNVGQRLTIREKYKSLFNQNLGDALDMIINDNLSKLLRMLLLSPIERDCFELRRILKGANPDDNILVEIFFSRSNKHIQTLRNSYQKLFQNTLEQDIIGDRDNHSKRIFLALLQSNRPEDNEVDDNEILNDAKNLYETGTKWKTDGSTFVRLLCTRSNIQLKQIFDAYQQFSKVDIEQAIKVYIEGNLYHTLMAIVRIIRNRPRFFAYSLKKSLKGATINEDNLNRIIVSRCEVDMVQIKLEYEKITKRTLYDQFQTDINGGYKRAILELLRQRIEPNAIIESALQNSNGQTEAFKNLNSNRSSVRWREPDDKVSSDLLTQNPLGRSISERAMYFEQKTDHTKPSIGQLNRSSKSQSNGSVTINAKLQSKYVNRRPFVPLATTHENLSNYEN